MSSELKFKIERSLNSIFFIFISIVILFLQTIVPSAYPNFLGVFDPKTVVTYGFIVGYSVFCFCGLTSTINWFVLKDSLRNCGLQAPKNGLLALFFTIVCISVLTPWIYIFSKLHSFQLCYSLGQISLLKFTFIHFVLMPFYYFAEEFFFRGFLFLTLWRKVKWHSFWITDIIFTVSHLGKPGYEILMCIPLSVVLNCLTLTTRSIYPAFIVHYSQGVLLNILVNYSELQF